MVGKWSNGMTWETLREMQILQNSTPQLFNPCRESANL